VSTPLSYRSVTELAAIHPNLAEYLGQLREDKELMDKFDRFISTEETQRLFLLPTRRDCNSVREALRVATSCHVPEEAK
jgi:hypothetical protein